MSKLPKLPLPTPVPGNVPNSEMARTTIETSPHVTESHAPDLRDSGTTRQCQSQRSRRCLDRSGPLALLSRIIIPMMVEPLARGHVEVCPPKPSGLTE